MEEEKDKKGKKLVDVGSKYKLSGKILNQDEIDDIVKKYKEKK